MMKKLFVNLLASCTLLIASNIEVTAQSLIFDDVNRFETRNMGPILENENVKGYYVFYKVERKTSKFELNEL